MRLSELSIERPVLATVMSLVIFLFGAISLTRLPNRELPNVDPPVVSVTTVYPGAAPEVVETSVTEPLEDQIVGIEGIRHLTSLSREQVSSITVEFELFRDPDEAANDVRDRVARARRLLPEEVEEPTVAKRDADARPILWIALSGVGYDQIGLTYIAETRIQDRLSNLPGVANVIMGGERRMSMRVWVDNDQLTAHGLTVADVDEALRRENVDIPSGRIESAGREFTVQTLGELRTARGFDALIVANVNGEPVRLGDLARIEVGPEDERKLVRFNGVPAIGLGVVKLSRANTLATVDAVKAELESTREDLPEGVELTIAFDSSVFIRRAIRDVTQTLFEAVVLVVIVIYLFLRRLRSTLIPAVAIPVSIVGTFAVLYFAGFSINTLTLMGLTLAIGLVVDDAIVVLENVTRWVEDGTPPREAARRGMREISFAVVAATVSVVAVFLPLAFLYDTTGRLFREFGVTVATAVAISGFVALTLSPALAARVLRPHGPEAGVRARLAQGFERTAAAYARLLRPALTRRGVAVTVGALWFALGLALLALGWIPSEFVPEADRGSLLIFTRAPEGSTIEYTDRYQRSVEEVVAAVPEVEKQFSVVALGLGTPGLVNEGALFCSLAPWEERDRSTQDVVAELSDALWDVPGIQAFPSSPPALGRRFGSSPVELVIQGPEVEAVAGYANELKRRAAAEIRDLRNLSTDLLLNKPQLEVEIDRDRASDLGVSAREIATTLQVLLGGSDLSTFKAGGETYKVMVQLERPARSDPADLLELYVHGPSGLIPLSSVVNVRNTTTPRGIPHFDRRRAATVTANLVQGADQGAILGRMKRLAEEIVPTERGYRVAFAGESEEFFESRNALLFAYLLAVVIIYLVLAGQFESFLDPLVILVAVALSFTGALLTIRLTGHTLNLFSQIGLVMLVGLVTKNSILIVEFSNQLRDRGRPLFDAAFEAARIRFRPVLMTALSTIVGIMPIALALGAGGEARAPLGVAVVGGMFFSTLFTIFVVPASWMLVEHARVRLRREPAGARAPASGSAPAS